MSLLKIYSEKDCNPLISKRAGETKFGEDVLFLEHIDDLPNKKCNYVLLGIPEDIGVRANLGKAGTSKAWNAGLTALLNIQQNEFLKPENLIVLGEIDCDNQMAKAAKIQQNGDNFEEKLGDIVTQIDDKVSFIVRKIVAANKIPIIIGGGHNNSFGNIKGCSLALNKSINCINFDAHSDFRSLEHRHSGNGFSFAMEKGFLNNYFIFGLHRNYTSQGIFQKIETNKQIAFSLFEDIAITQNVSFSEALQNAENFCCDKDFGLELDLDSIENMGSSAMTPSGFTLTEARKFISHFSKFSTCKYIHICEGSPHEAIFPNQVGKAIAYLISDIICSR